MKNTHIAFPCQIQQRDKQTIISCRQKLVNKSNNKIMTFRIQLKLLIRQIFLTYLDQLFMACEGGSSTCLGNVHRCQFLDNLFSNFLFPSFTKESLIRHPGEMLDAAADVAFSSCLTVNCSTPACFDASVSLFFICHRIIFFICVRGYL